MSQYQYLQLQPVDDDDEDPLNDYSVDETIDLTEDEDEDTLDREWARVMDSLKKDMKSSSNDEA